MGAYSGKLNVTVCRRSVCLSHFSSLIECAEHRLLNVTHQMAARDAVSVHSSEYCDDEHTCLKSCARPHIVAKFPQRQPLRWRHTRSVLRIRDSRLIQQIYGSSLLSGRNVRWQHRMVPPVSYGEYADGTYRQTDRRIYNDS